MDVIITGATGGIGRCLARRVLASPQAGRVYCQFRNQEKFESLFGGLAGIVPDMHAAPYGGEAPHVIQELYKDRPEEAACIFTAFSISPIKRAGTYTPEEIKESLAVNIQDMVIFTNWLLRFKRECGARLRLVNLDSGAAYKPLEGWGLYAASKAYVNMFLETVRLENPDVKAVSYDPGVVDTPMQKEIREADEKVFGQVGRFKEYYEQKMLRSPDIAAEEIVRRFIESWDGAGFKDGCGRRSGS